MALRDQAYRKAREQAWVFSPVWWTVGGHLGRPYGPEEVLRAAHRLKAWRRAMDWVEARGKVPRRGGEEEVEVPPERRRRRPPRQYSPWDPTWETRWDLPPDVAPPDEWDEWVEEDVGPWEAGGTLEGGVSPGPSVQPGLAAEGVEVAEVGETRLVELQLNPGATASLVSPAVAGPLVVERVAVWVETTSAVVEFEMRAVAAGTDVGTATPPGQLPGLPLWRTVTVSGLVTQAVTDRFQGFFEAWPRVLVGWQSVAFALAARNADATMGHRLVGAVDVRRAVVR